MPGSGPIRPSAADEDSQRHRAEIMARLAVILASPAFARAGRMQRLISFLVGEALDGRSDRLKEYTIAVEVFDKPIDFNPATNPIVRVEVGRLRRLLTQYQLETGADDDLVISIPKGSYIPDVRRKAPAEPVAEAGTRAAGPGVLPERPAAAIPDLQRRQVTVLVCGLECNPGNHADTELDPERYQEIFTVFFDSVTTISRHYAGTVEGQASDRLLIVFGWPEALENAAGRALTAAFEIVSFFRGVPDQEAFGVRVAVVTGQVIIQSATASGPAAGRAPSVVGEATALAGRMLPQVPLNGVLVAESARRIAGNAFEFVNAGLLDQRDGDGLLWRLVGIRSSGNRFSASASNLQVPIVGRREELALLLRRWQFTQKGEGQTVTIVGEAGIGKSKLAHAFLDKAASASIQVGLQCSPYHGDSPLYPLAACIAGDQGGLLSFMYPDEVSEVIAYIKGEDHPEGKSRYSTPVGRRDHVFGLLSSILVRISALRPCIVLIEDAHWADPTTLEFIRHASAICKAERIMVVVTSRPVETGIVPSRLTEATALNLSRLPQSYCLSIIDRLSALAPLSSWKRSLILDKADGIPLYIEELTKSLMAPDSQRSVLIPETLADLLTAQLDRLGPARTVAQVAAVIGREFSQHLLAAVLDRPESEIEAVLDQLRAADVIVAHGTGRPQSLAFRHALLRDAAYESLVARTRRHWHAQVAAVLQSTFPDVMLSQPELVARHWTGAGQVDAAVPFWFDAGRKAASRFANAEAISHFRAGLDLLRDQTDGRDRRREELSFLTELGLVLRVSRGYGHPELGQIYRRASELCSALGDVEALAKNIFGLWTFAAAHADWGTTEALVEEFTALSDRQDDDQLHVERWRLQGASAVYQGRFEAAATAFREALRRYDPVRHGARFGFDPGPTVLIYLSWAELHLGDVAEADASAARAVALAEEKGHAPTIALVMTWQILYLATKQNWEEVKRVGAALDALCAEKGFPHWSPFGKAFGLFAEFLDSKDPALIGAMLSAAEEFRDYWGGFLSPCFWITAAEASRIADDPEKARELLEAARCFQTTHGEYLWKDELNRVKESFHG